MERLQILRVIDLLKQTAVAYDEAVKAGAHAAGITKQEADVLAYLANHAPPLTAQQVARGRGFSKAYVSKAVDRLMRRGFVTAEPGSDRRTLLLRLTPEAGDTVARILATQAAFFDGLLHGVTPAQHRACDAALARMEDNLRRMR